MPRKSNKKGFTLIELLISIALLGVIASISLMLLRPAIFFGKGRDARRKTDLETVRSALEQYYLDNGRQYPAYVNPDTAQQSYARLGTNAVFSQYINFFPNDPRGGSYEYRVDTAQGNKCYELAATLEVDSPTRYEVCGGSLYCQNAAVGGVGFCKP